MYKRYLIPGIFLVLALVLLIGTGATRSAKAQWLSRTVFMPFTRTLQVFATIQQLQQENYTLQKQVTLQVLENLNLRNQLNIVQTNRTFYFGLPDIPFTMAEVVGYSGQFSERNLIINKGLDDGIEPDSPVVSSDGIIGKIISVSRSNGVILPLTHTQFQLAVMDKNTSVQGVLQSDLLGTTSMNLIKLGSQVGLGDTIVTSNLSRLFPKGYPVGKIRRVKESQDNLFLSAEIVPFTLVENLEHVFILKKSYINRLLEPLKIKTESDTLSSKADSTRISN